MTVNTATAEIAANTATINALAKVIKKLDEQNQRFANSLVSQWDRKQVLSARQWAWVQRLTDKANGAEPVAVTVPDGLGRIVETLTKAGQTERFPAIELPTPSGATVRMSLQGKRASFPGAVSVSVVPAGETERTWIGRILTDGRWMVGRAFEGQPEEALVMTAIASHLSAAPKTTTRRRRQNKKAA